MTDTPADIKPQFLNIARRLQSVARASSGVSVVVMRVVLDESGNPKFWTAPTVTLIEPRSAADEIIEFLSTQQQG